MTILFVVSAFVFQVSCFLFGVVVAVLYRRWLQFALCSLFTVLSSYFPVLVFYCVVQTMATLCAMFCFVLQVSPALFRVSYVFGWYDGYGSCYVLCFLLVVLFFSVTCVRFFIQAMTVLFVMFSFSCTVSVLPVLGVLLFCMQRCLLRWGDDYSLLYVLRSVFSVCFCFRP